MNSNTATLQSYEANPQGYIDSRSPVECQQFCRWIVDGLEGLPKDAEIFEIGSGPGYDADYLETLGYTVVRSDAAKSFVEFNRKRGKVAAQFDIVNDAFTELYDAVLAVNVMQHLEKQDFITAMHKIFAALKSGGRFLFSITIGEDAEEWHDDQGGARYFKNWPLEDLKAELVGVGFTMRTVREVGYKNWFDIVAEKA